MPLDEKTLKASLESGALYPVYLIYGNDGFLKKQAVSRIIKASVGVDDGLNLLRFDGECNLQYVYDELNGFPVMADKKCVILSDYDIYGASSEDFERLLTLAGDSYESSVFVIYFDTLAPDQKKEKKPKKEEDELEKIIEEEAAKRERVPRFRALCDAVKKSGGAAAELNHRTREELARQLASSAKRQGALLSVSNAGYLIDSCSAETEILINELSKLIAFSKGSEITREMIDCVAVRSVEASIYDMSKRIMAGNSAGAMSLLDELFFTKVPPEMIVFEMASCFINMFRVAAAADKGLRPNDISEDFKMGNRAFLLTRAADNLRRYDYKKLDLSFGALLEADRNVKSRSTDGRAVLEQLVVKLIYIMKTGESL